MFDSWIDKKRYCYFPGPFSHSKNKIKIELDLSDYAKIMNELELKAVPSVLNNFKKYSR